MAQAAAPAPKPPAREAAPAAADAKAAPAAKGDPAAGENTSAPRRRRFPVLALALVLLVAVAGGAAWHFMNDSAAPAAEGQEASASAEKPAEKAEKPRVPLFVALETFTVNLQPGDSRQYLQVNMTVDLADRAAEAALKQNMPEVRNRVLLLLSSTRAAELYGADGKRKLAADVRSTLNALMTRSDAGDAPAVRSQPAAGNPAPEGGPIAGVYFTSFVIQ